MKRIFTGLLALLLLIPAVCFVGFSEGADAVIATGGGRLPARYGTITADGEAEAAMAYDTPILKDRSGFITLGATWNETTLALGVISEQVVLSNTYEVNSRTNCKIDSLTVALANGVYTYTADGGLVRESGEVLADDAVSGVNADGYLVELLLPIAAVRAYRDENGDICANITITVKTGNVTEVFDGKIVFTAQTLTWGATVAGECGVTNQKFSSLYGYSGKNGDFDYENGIVLYHLSRSKSENGVHAFQNISAGLFSNDKKTTVQFDFRMSTNTDVSSPKTTEASSNGWGNQALATSGNGIRALIYLGAGEQIKEGGWRDSAAFPIVLGIYNTANGLTVYLDDGQSPYGGEGIRLGKQAGEYIRLGFETAPVEGGYSVTVLVDGIAVGSMTATAAHAQMPLSRGNGLAVGAAVDALENPTTNSFAHILYSNISVSEEKTDVNLDILLINHGILQDNCFQKSGIRADETYAIRFLTTIEDFLCDEYTEVGFEAIALRTDGTESNPIERRTNKVYSTIIADDETVSAPNGTYWVAVAVNGIPADAAVTLVIRPFAVTANGEKHYGAAGQITLPYTSN